jgi:hypothetical protein
MTSGPNVFALLLTLYFPSTGLHVTQHLGIFLSRPRCEDEMEHEAQFMRFVSDTRIRFRCTEIPRQRKV